MSEPPPDTYKAGVENAKTTYELVKDVVTWISPAISTAASKRKALKSLNDKIGEWLNEAKDSEGNWQQPVLRKDALDAHLLLKKGELHPRDTCTSSFAWAKLLYALNIRPDSDPKVLEWRQPEGNDPTTTGMISLAVEGEALCDIINLYQRYIASSVWSGNEFRFSFGTLKLMNEETHSFKFESLSAVVLKHVHKPFQYKIADDEGQREGHLKLQHITSVEAYYGAIDVSISDRAAQLESGKKPLQDRVRALLQGMALFSDANWEKGYLLTPTWIKEASDVQKRVTTNGGEDPFLVDFICRNISRHDELIAEVKKRLPFSRRDKWEEELRTTVEGLCMFKENQFSFIWSMDHARRSEKDALLMLVKQHLPSIIPMLSEQDESAWARDLMEKLTTAELLSLLNLQHEIVNRPVIVLLQEPRKWDFMAEINSK